MTEKQEEKTTDEYKEIEKYPIQDAMWPSRRWNKDRTDYIDLSGGQETCVKCGFLEKDHPVIDVKDIKTSMEEGVECKLLCKKFTPKLQPVLPMLIKEPKNHGQELLPVQRGTDVLGKRLKPADTPSGDNSKLPFESLEAEGTTQNHKKGCGKKFYHEDFEKELVCDESVLCPICQEK